jgi:GNAT superfamily N-acetyltransferase
MPPSFLPHATSPTLLLRPATDADLPQILAALLDPSTLSALGDTAEQAQRTLRNTWAEDPATSALQHFVVEDRERAELIAYLRLEYPFHKPDCLWLTHFFVFPSWRGQGYGRRIMDLLKRAAQATGCVGTFGMHTLSDNTAAVALYTSTGFTCVQREPWQTNDGGETERLTFRRLLSPTSL